MMGAMNLHEADAARSILQAHIKRNDKTNPYPENWRNLPELPSAEEIMPKDEIQSLTKEPPGRPLREPRDGYKQDPRDGYKQDPIYDPNLPTNNIEGPWESKMAYVGSHYQMLREDAIAGLRRAVREVKNNPSMNDDDDTYIYTHVTFLGLQLSRVGAAFRVAFSTQRARNQIRWKQSKRLLQGSLVALSPQRDKFRTICKLAVIAARPFEGGLDQNPPTVDLFWADLAEAVFDPVEKYLMVEAREGYYEASRHMLVALQKLMTEEFVLRCTASQLIKHVAFLEQPVAPPSYLETQPFLNLTSLEKVPSHSGLGSTLVDSETDLLFNVDVLNKFPKNWKSTMDDSQMQACRDILTGSTTIIHGPPGTGKTFASVSALEVMIDNLGENDPPLIIAAQTNHALDQLINHIMMFDERIVRLGGRADKENEKILKRTLFKLRQANPNVPYGKAGLKHCNNEFERIIQSIRMILNSILNGEIFTAEDLLEHGVITPTQRESLFDAEDDDWGDGNGGSGLIVDWVGEHLTEIESVPMVNFGLPFEDEDVTYEHAQRLPEELGEDENRENFSAKDTESVEHLSGAWLPFRRKFTGAHSVPLAETRARKLLRKHSSLNDIPHIHRGDVYRFLEKKLNQKVLENLLLQLKGYQQIVEDYQVTRGVSNLRMVRCLGIKVIGCTTTGLAKYRGFISALRPRTLLIEEAAEAIEGAIMAGLVESLEQLILVGDHQQLRAQCTVRALEKAPYFLQVSMFERLINNGFQYVMLNKQRRMIPEIRRLLCIEPHPFYRGLQDHESMLDRVHTRPPVPGMGGKDTYFFHHNWPEARSANGSRYNADEAEMMAGFFHYLVYNGVDPAKITVLTFYNGQRRCLIKELQKKKKMYGGENSYFKVFTVDSYQGEENDIILLSLVRSNSYLSVGFLENKNRLVVALSRARRGLYIFGNTITLAMAETTRDKYRREPLWDPLINFMKVQDRYSIDGGLPITCTKHGNTVRIIDPCSWYINSGGCEEPCDEGCLPCGHACILTCHPFEHERILCKEPCPRILSCGHGCSNLCFAKPCHCSFCALNKSENGRQMFGSSDPFAAPDLETYKILYEEDEVEYEAELVFNASSQNNRSSSRGQDLPQRASLETTQGDASSSYTKDDCESRNSRPSSHLVTSQRQPRGNRSSWDKNFQNKTSDTVMGSNTQATQAWHSWDAKKADQEIEQNRTLQDKLEPDVDRSTLVFKETFVPVTVENGYRQLSSSGPVMYVVSRGISDGDRTGFLESTPKPMGLVNLVGQQDGTIVEETKKDTVVHKPVNLIDLDEESVVVSNDSSHGTAIASGFVSMRADIQLSTNFFDSQATPPQRSAAVISRDVLELGGHPFITRNHYLDDSEQLIEGLTGDTEKGDQDIGKPGNPSSADSRSQVGKPVSRSRQYAVAPDTSSSDLPNSEVVNAKGKDPMLDAEPVSYLEELDLITF